MRLKILMALVVTALSADAFGQSNGNFIKVTVRDSIWVNGRWIKSISDDSTYGTGSGNIIPTQSAVQRGLLPFLRISDVPEYAWSRSGNTVTSFDTLGTNNNHPIRLKSNGKYVGQIGPEDWGVYPSKTAGSILFIKNQDTSATATGMVSIYKPRFGDALNSNIAGISLFPRNGYASMAADGPTWLMGFAALHPRGYFTISGRDELGSVYPAISITNGFHVGIGRTGATGIVDATSHLQLAPGVDTVAAFKLTAGSLLSTPQAGAFEYRNAGADSALYYTLNAERRKFAFQADPFYSGTLSPTAIARYYSGEYITDHAHYAFLANDSVNFSGIGTQGRAAFNDNTRFGGSASVDHVHSFQSFPHWNSTGTAGRLVPYWAFAEVTAGTVVSLPMFMAKNPSGSGTINNLYGLYVEQMTRGSNNWAIWADGNTPSFFGGNVWIGTSTGLGKVHVLTNNTSGLIVQNSVTPANNSGAFVRLYQSGTPTATDQVVGGLLYATNPTGSTIRGVAQIGAYSDATFSDGVSHPTRLSFFTTPSGSTVLTERLRIASSGAVGVNETVPGAQFDIKGTSATTGAALRVRNSSPSAVFQVDNNGDITLFGGVKLITGAVSPEGSIPAPVGSLYLRTGGGAGSTFYVKESGTGNSGWVAK